MTDERTAGGAPLDPEEAALLAALRARGPHALAQAVTTGRFCKKCNTEKPLAEFYSYKDGTLYPRCKLCHRAAMKPLSEAYYHLGGGKERRQRVREANLPTDKMTCRVCNQDKSVGQFRAHRKGSDRRRTVCKSCSRLVGSKERRRESKKASGKRRRANADNRAKFLIIDCRTGDKKRGLVGNLDEAFVREALAQPCSYCCGSNLQMTLDRIDNAVGHMKDNVVPACIRCNIIRGSMPYAAWLEVAKAIRRVTELGLLDGWRERPLRPKAQVQAFGVDAPRAAAACPP